MPLTIDPTIPAHPDKLTATTLMALPAGSVGVLTGPSAITSPPAAEPDTVSVAFARIDDSDAIVASPVDAATTENLLAPMADDTHPVALYLTDHGPVDLLAEIGPLPTGLDDTTFFAHPAVIALMKALDALPADAVVILGDWTPISLGTLAIKRPSPHPIGGWLAGSGEETYCDIDEFVERLLLDASLPDTDDGEDYSLAELHPTTTLRLLPYLLHPTDSPAAAVAP